MKLFLSAILAVTSLIGTSSFAQTFSLADLGERGETSDMGYHPKSLESLVGSASIIVKGKFGRFISSELFYGFDSSRELFQEKYRLTDIETEESGLPVSSYIINVQEVFLGDESLQGQEIIYRVGESRDLYRNEFANSTDERLFFLGRNPDGSFTAVGEANVQVLRNGSYSYDSLAPSSNRFVGRTLNFVDSVREDEFEQLIRMEIQRQYPK